MVRPQIRCSRTPEHLCAAFSMSPNPFKLTGEPPISARPCTFAEPHCLGVTVAMLLPFSARCPLLPYQLTPFSDRCPPFFSFQIVVPWDDARHPALESAVPVGRLGYSSEGRRVRHGGRGRALVASKKRISCFSRYVYCEKRFKAVMDHI